MQSNIVNIVTKLPVNIKHTDTHADGHTDTQIVLLRPLNFQCYAVVGYHRNNIGIAVFYSVLGTEIVTNSVCFLHLRATKLFLNLTTHFI